MSTSGRTARRHLILGVLPIVCAGGWEQDPQQPRYRIDAEVGDDGIEAVAEIVVPVGFRNGGVVRIDPHAAGVADGHPRLRILEARDEQGRPLRPDLDADGTYTYHLADAGAAPMTLRIRYRVPFDRGDIADLGYFLFPANRRGTRWYPELIASDGATVRFADFDVRLDWPDSLTVLASVAITNEARAGARRRGRFGADHLEGFTLALGPRHELVRLERDGVRMEIMVPPELVRAYTEVGERALDAAVFYRELYGFFPNNRLGILPGPAGYWGGFPMPNVFMIHRGNLTEDFVRFITAHELGHYYWGLHVLDAGERLGWLMLANGIFADQLYLAAHNGRTLEQQWRTRGNGDWIEDFLTAQVAGWEQRLGMDRAADDSLHFDYNSLIRHGKAATGIYLQVRRIGTQRFVELQRELLHDFRHSPLDTETFVQRLEAAGAADAGTFFDEWVRGDASIGYAVDVVEPVPEQPGTHRVVIQRFGTVRYPIEVEVSGGGGAVERRVIRSPFDRDTLVFRMEGPVRVRLDPDGAVPMWNSGHPGIRRLFIHALENAGLTEPFLALSGAYLEEHQDPTLLRRRRARLGALGRETEAAVLVEP